MDLGQQRDARRVERLGPRGARLLHAEDAPQRRVDALPRDELVLDAQLQARDGLQLHVVGAAEQHQVAAGLDGHDGARLDADLVAEHLHLETLRDGDALEAELVPEQVVHHLLREAGVVDAHGRAGDAAAADEHGVQPAGGDGVAERHEGAQRELLERLRDDGHVQVGAEEVQVPVRGEVLAAGGDAGVLVAVHGGDAVLRHLLRVVARGAHAERLVPRVEQHVQHGAEDQVDADGRDLGGGGLGDLVGQLRAPGGGLAHGAGELADVVLIVEAVDAAILLVERDEEGLGVAGLVGDGLELLHEPGRLVGGCGGELACGGSRRRRRRRRK